MLKKSSAVNSKIVRPSGSKRIEKPVNEKSFNETEIKEKSKKSNNNIVTANVKKTTTATATKRLSSRQEPNAKPQINSKTVVTKTKQTTPIAPAIKPKISNVTPSKVIRQQPMRAIHQVQAKKPVAEKNVMNTIHNVTVASPPSVRKVQANPQLRMDMFPTEREQIHPPNTLPRERTKTRTLGPEEVVILKQSKSDQKSTNSPDNSSPDPAEIEQKPLIIQEPIAFEITFEKAASPTIGSSSKQSQDASDGDYEDDFDSYESDFETESSTSSRSRSTSSKSETKSNDDSNSTSFPTESHPVFSLTMKLDEDRDFDSGTYELKGTAEKVELDSIDERELHSEGQNDSGFGYNNATPSPVEQRTSTSSSVYSKTSKKPTYNKRAMELMKKIILDTMTFTLFELKPLSYDLYMKIYGHKNTNQNSSQTVANLVDQDVQTENKTKHSMWTQYPPNYVANVNSTETYHQDRIGCGEGFKDIITAQHSDECIENSLKIINRTNVLRDVRSTKLINYERLNYFLQKSAITVSAICDAGVAIKDLHKSELPFSDGYYKVSINESKMLKNTAVYYMYSNPMVENIVYLAHRQKSTSRTHDNSFVSVWNIYDTKKPTYLLSCWSLIICLEVHHHFQDVVIGGLTDGCVAVWNFNESTFWHQNIDQEALPPTQIVSPSFDTKSISFDFGCLISIKSVHPIDRSQDDDFKLTQICTLHEFGMLTIWSILKTNSHSTNSESPNERKIIDHRSPWSKIQLIQSNVIDLALIDLNKKVRPKSRFEKKKLYFESNLLNDTALQELHDYDAQKDLLNQSKCFRCVDMEYHADGVVVATNKSFLIFVPASLNRNSLRKIFIDETNFLHATKLRSTDDVLLVGLTDGSVKVIQVKPSSMCRESNDNVSKTMPGVSLEQNNFSAKSCAIQNIIKEERKFLPNDGLEDQQKQTEKVIDDTTLRGNRFINNQLLLPAMSSNRDFVRWLDISVNLNCMMGLCGERLRIITFPNSVEARGVDLGDTQMGYATIVLGYNHREYMVSLEGESVRIYLLRKMIL